MTTQERSPALLGLVLKVRTNPLSHPRHHEMHERSPVLLGLVLLATINPLSHLRLHGRPWHLSALHGWLRRLPDRNRTLLGSLVGPLVMAPILSHSPQPLVALQTRMTRTLFQLAILVQAWAILVWAWEGRPPQFVLSSAQLVMMSRPRTPGRHTLPALPAANNILLWAHHQIRTRNLPEHQSGHHRSPHR